MNTNRTLDQMKKTLSFLKRNGVSPENLRYVFRGPADGAEDLIEKMLKVAKDYGYEGVFTVDNIEFLNKQFPIG